DGNKNADPGFVDPRQAETGSPTTEGDYHLSSTSSPAYNAGSSAYYAANRTPDLSAVTTDPDGKPRNKDDLPDMGAYEY
ncbi:MAG: hypothetical protein LBQ57_06020, partial [Spirochaetales bacterium]|nr:hypothetical protein [Spirochaetales bacterium]